MPVEVSVAAYRFSHSVIRERYDFNRAWYYILKESEHNGGERLGPVGSRIVAEVFVGLLDGSPHSYRTEEPGWTPTLGAQPGSFTMKDLITLTGDINPLG